MLAAAVGVFRSTDGVTWTAVPGLETLAPTCFAVTADGTLLVGTAASGLFTTPMP